MKMCCDAFWKLDYALFPLAKLTRCVFEKCDLSQITFEETATSAFPSRFAIATSPMPASFDRDCRRSICADRASTALKSTLEDLKGLPQRFLIALVIAALTAAARAEDWKPATGPLMTRWAKDVSPTRVHPEYPRPQLVRSQWQNLNGLWDLAIVDAEQAAPPENFGQQILVPFPVESALSGVMQRANHVWYRRAFDIPANWHDKRVLLHFGAVDWQATVSVNGHELGTHRGGYDAFSFDVTDALKPTGPQELVVRVFDPTSAGGQPRGKQIDKPAGCFYTQSTGIWQTVWLEPVSPPHVEHLNVHARLRQVGRDG